MLFCQLQQAKWDNGLFAFKWITVMTFLKGDQGPNQEKMQAEDTLYYVFEALQKHQKKMHWSCRSGSACSSEGNVGSECHTESTENQAIVLISRLNLWQTTGVCFFLLAHFISQIPRGARLQGWDGGSQISPLKGRCFGFLLVPPSWKWAVSTKMDINSTFSLS